MSFPDAFPPTQENQTTPFPNPLNIVDTMGETLDEGPSALKLPEERKDKRPLLSRVSVTEGERQQLVARTSLIFP